MTVFSPFAGLFGGLLIGLSISILLLFNGRITGISGIFSALFTPKSGEWLWRFIYLAGIIAGAFAYQSIAPASFTPRESYPLSFLIIGGVLVGFGTRMGSGCTSGHGICGIARLSMRSVVATGIFMASGIITVYLVRHIVGIPA